MKVYTYSQARQSLSEALDRVKKEEFLNRKRNGDVFRIAPASRNGSRTALAAQR